MAEQSRFTGVERFKAGLDRIGGQVEKRTRLAVTAGARAMRDQARKNADTGRHRKGEPTTAQPGAGPNRVTGNLVRNIASSAAKPAGDGWWRATVYVRRKAFYGRVLEQDTEAKTVNVRGHARTVHTLKRMQQGPERVHGVSAHERRRKGSHAYPFFGPAVESVATRIVPGLFRDAWDEGHRG